MGYDVAGFLTRSYNMLGKVILSILFIFINALVLWFVSCLGSGRQSYKKALLTTSLIFVILLLRFITFKEFHSSILSNFFGTWYFEVGVRAFIIWLIYRYNWKSVFLMGAIWVILQILFDSIQNSILNLPWDSVMQAF